MAQTIEVPLAAVQRQTPDLLEVPVNELEITSRASVAPSTAPLRVSSAPTLVGGLAVTAGEALQGVGRGLASTVFHGGDVIRRATGQERILGTPEVQAAITPPPTPAGKAGFFMEQLGEFLVPLNVGAKARALVRGPRWVKGMVRGLGESMEMGAKAGVQTGGDAEQTMFAALAGAASPAFINTAQAVGRVAFQKLPERLYGQIFRLAEDDLRQAYQAAAKGHVNPTLAKEMLERGVFGSSRNLAVYSLKKLDALETQLQRAVLGRNIRMPQKQDLIQLVDAIAGEFGGAFSQTGRTAAQMASALRAGIRGPYMNAGRALALKRLLDQARNTSAFRLSAKLSPKQEEFKAAADLVRQTIHRTIPRASALLNEERIFIEAVDEIVTDAVRRTNRRLLGLTDYVLGGGGMASGSGVSGVGAAAAVRGFQNPFTLTGLGQLLRRVGLMAPPVEPVARATIGTTSVTTRDDEP